MIAAVVTSALLLLALNLFTMLRFWQDKKRAIAGERRIPEADLLTLALVGGVAGRVRSTLAVPAQDPQAAILAMRLFLIAAVQAGALIGLIAF